MDDRAHRSNARADDAAVEFGGGLRGLVDEVSRRPAGGVVERSGFRLKRAAALAAVSLLRRRGYIRAASGLRFTAEFSEVPDQLLGDILLGWHERDELWLLRRHLRPGARVLELGGCVGFLACHAASLVGSRGVVRTVEPVKGLIEVIQRNAELNGLAVEVIEGAAGVYGDGASVAPADDLVSTAVSSGRTTSSSLASGQPVRCLRMSELLTPDLGRDVTLLVDIEGAELDLVREEGSIIRESCRLILIEVHPRLDHLRAGRCIAELAELGYRWVDARGQVVVLERCGQRCGKLGVTDSALAPAASPGEA